MCRWYFSFRGRGGCRCPDLGGGQMFGQGKACSEAAVRNWRSAFGSHDRTFAPLPDTCLPKYCHRGHLSPRQGRVHDCRFEIVKNL